MDKYIQADGVLACTKTITILNIYFICTQFLVLLLEIILLIDGPIFCEDIIW